MSSRTWRVTVYTGDRNNAGTDARIYISVVGPKGESSEVRLDNDDDNFERNKVDRFVVAMKDVGKPEKLTVRHSNTGNKPGWFLNKIKLYDETTGDVYTFPCYNWLDESTVLMRTLLPE